MHANESAHAPLSHTPTEKVKRIRVWINCEPRCYEFVVKSKFFRSWNSFLSHVTTTTKPRFGAIRALISVKTQQEVTSIDDLREDDKYIGFGNVSHYCFDPRDYVTKEERETLRKKAEKKLYTGPVHCADTIFLRDMGRKRLTLIYAALNGVNTLPPHKVIFNQQDVKNWELITNYLSKIFSISEGIGSICTIDGEKLRKAEDLQHGYLYVIVPNNALFAQMDYLKIFNNPYPHQAKKRISIFPKRPKSNGSVYKEKPHEEQPETLGEDSADTTLQAAQIIETENTNVHETETAEAINNLKNDTAEVSLPVPEPERVQSSNNLDPEVAETKDAVDNNDEIDKINDTETLPQLEEIKLITDISVESEDTKINTQETMESDESTKQLLQDTIEKLDEATKNNLSSAPTMLPPEGSTINYDQDVLS